MQGVGGYCVPSRQRWRFSWADKLRIVSALPAYKKHPAIVTLQRYIKLNSKRDNGSLAFVSPMKYVRQYNQPRYWIFCFASSLLISVGCNSLDMKIINENEMMSALQIDITWNHTGGIYIDIPILYTDSANGILSGFGRVTINHDRPCTALLKICEYFYVR